MCVVVGYITKLEREDGKGKRSYGRIKRVKDYMWPESGFGEKGDVGGRAMETMHEDAVMQLLFYTLTSILTVCKNVDLYKNQNIQ